jgi:hypothetical protein
MTVDDVASASAQPDFVVTFGAHDALAQSSGARIMSLLDDGNSGNGFELVFNAGGTIDFYAREGIGSVTTDTTVTPTASTPWVRVSFDADAGVNGTGQISTQLSADGITWDTATTADCGATSDIGAMVDADLTVGNRSSLNRPYEGAVKYLSIDIDGTQLFELTPADIAAWRVMRRRSPPPPGRR